MALPELSAMSLETIVATALSRDDEDDTYSDCVRELHKRGIHAVFKRASELCSALRGSHDLAPHESAALVITAPAFDLRRVSFT